MLILVYIYFNKYLYKLILHEVHCWVLGTRAPRGWSGSQDAQLPAGAGPPWRVWMPETVGGRARRGAASSLLPSSPFPPLLTHSRLSLQGRKIFLIPPSRQY